MSRLEHGTPEGFDRGCVDDESCPAFAVHGMSCETAHIRFMTGERRYMRLRGRGLTSTEIAARLGFSAERSAAKAAEARERVRAGGARGRASAAKKREEKGAVMATPKDAAKAVKKKAVPASEPVVEAVKVIAEAAPGFETFKKKRKYSPPSVVPVGGASTSEVRAWARENGFTVPDRGLLKADVIEAFNESRSTSAAGLLREKREAEGRVLHEVDEGELRARVASPAVFAKADDIVEAELARLNAEADGEPDVEEGLMLPDYLPPAVVAVGQQTFEAVVRAYEPAEPASGPSYEGLAWQLDEMARYAERMRRERDAAHRVLELVLRKWARASEQVGRTARHVWFVTSMDTKTGKPADDMAEETAAEVARLVDGERRERRLSRPWWLGGAA